MPGGVESARYRLYGLDPERRYTVTDADGGVSSSMTGRQLMTQGVTVRLATPPGAALLTYRRVK